MDPTKALELLFAALCDGDPEAAEEHAQDLQAQGVRHCLHDPRRELNVLFLLDQIEYFALHGPAGVKARIIEYGIVLDASR